MRVGPYGAQAVAGRLVAQVIHGDAVAVAIGKLRVALALSREIRVNLDDVAHIHHQQERGPAIIARHGAGVAIRLISGAHHGVIPAPRAARAVPLAGGAGQVGQQGGLRVILGLVRGDALFRFHDEMARAVEVDETARLAAGVNEGHGVLETIGIGARGLGRGGGSGQVQHLAEFVREGLEVGAFAAARLLPA